MRLRRYLCAAIATALVLTGCGALTGKPFPQTVNDVALTTQVKSRLATIQGVGTLTSISVSTHDDWVTLRGVVSDEATRQRVLRAAGGVAGDNRVIDNLAVMQPPAASAATR
jgi:osmotically-inducible protein OsmY